MSGRMLLTTLLAVVSVALVAVISQHDARSCEQSSDDVMQALSGDPEVSQQGVQALRARGPSGLEQILELRDAVAEQVASTESFTTEWGELIQRLYRINEAADQVGGQLHCTVSRLFWYTDIEQAQAAARASGKPILSLRLLGRLTDECSCANSRFFRTALYSNEQISAVLRDNFVLHWETVRPVPVITIDFGDGRIVRRTLTGNSAHYLLDADGRPLDVLPGLYGPAAFQGWLERSLALAADWNDPNRDWGDSPEVEREHFLVAYHQQQLNNLATALAADLAAVGYSGPAITGVAEADEPADVAPEPANDSTPPAALAIPPAALEAAPVARGKYVVEAPVLLAIDPTPTETSVATISDEDLGNIDEATDVPIFTADLDIAFGKRLFEGPVLGAIEPLPRDAYFADISPETLGNIDEATWAQIAALHAGEAQLDEASIAQIRRENPTATQAGLIAITKMKVEDPLVQLVRNFQASMAVDTVRNEYILHRQIHQWFAEESAGQDRLALNERIYSDLFLTPSSDPWLGLIPANTYSALPNNGLVNDEDEVNTGG